MESLEQITMSLIVAAGDAKSSYIEAIQEAKEGKIDTAKEMIKKGKESALVSHKTHAMLLQESTKDGFTIPLLLLHAEDQMMSCEAICIMAEEFIELYQQNQILRERVCALEN